MKKILIAFFAVLVVASVYPNSADASWWNPKTWGKKGEFSSDVSAYPIRKLNGDEKSVMLHIGETVKVLGAKATITEVIEDSRCPETVQCIQAGTVRVNVKAKYGIFSKKIVLKQGEPYEFRGHTITLDFVTPQKMVNETIANGDYVFMISLGVEAKDDENKTDEKKSDEVKEEKKDEPSKKVSDEEVVMPLAKNMDILQMMRIQGEMHKQKAGNYDGVCMNAEALKAMKGTQGGKSVCYDNVEGWSVTVPLGAGYYGCADNLGTVTNRMRGVLPMGMTMCPMI